MAPKPSVVDKIVAKYGIPDRLYVDNGPAFRSRDVLDRLADLGIEVHFGAPHAARAKRPRRTERRRPRIVDLTEVNLDELGDC